MSGAFWVVQFAGPHQSLRKPRAIQNIVFFFWDNLEWGELDCYGGGVLRCAPTPADVRAGR